MFDLFLIDLEEEDAGVKGGYEGLGREWDLGA